MPILIIKALDCEENKGIDQKDNCFLEICLDDEPPTVRNEKLASGKRWVLNETFHFKSSVKINLWDKLASGLPGGTSLGTGQIGKNTNRRGTIRFSQNRRKYHLWYEVFQTNAEADATHKISRQPEIHVRDFLGRLGKGVLTDAQYSGFLKKYCIYQCRETISILNTFRFHRRQDGPKSNTTSLKRWIDQHSNPWGEDSVIPVSKLPEAKYYRDYLREAARDASGLVLDQWNTVNDEQSYCLAGLQQLTRKTREDYPFTHATMDWNMFQVPDPSFLYMLSYSAKRAEKGQPEEGYPTIENEWETGSFPVHWRPFWGEHTTCWGRHIYDVGHAPVHTEIHPPHSIIREHTTANNLGKNGEMVPVNRAIIGMCLSGGFPGNTGSRWQDEFGENAPPFFPDTRKHAWVTNLKEHPLKFQLFPPVKRPSNKAKLTYKIILCEYILVKGWDGIGGFLKHCQQNHPARGQLGFRVWDSTSQLPKGFPPKPVPSNLRPKVTQKDGNYLEVEIDLKPATQTPVGYYAIIDCGWDERGMHDITEYQVEFEEIKVIDTTETGDDWHLFYGINGQWAAWWSENKILKNKTYKKNQQFVVRTVNDMPLIIYDCGIDWDGISFTNEFLDSLRIFAPGPDHFVRIPENPGVTLLEKTSGYLLFKAPGREDGSTKTKHEWVIGMKKKDL